MAKQYEVGDRVRWHTGEDDTQGIIVERRVDDSEFDGHKYVGSETEPTFIVESEHGRRAAHHGAALRRAQ